MTAVTARPRQPPLPAARRTTRRRHGWRRGAGTARAVAGAGAATVEPPAAGTWMPPSARLEHDHASTQCKREHACETRCGTVAHRLRRGLGVAARTSSTMRWKRCCTLNESSPRVWRGGGATHHQSHCVGPRRGVLITSRSPTSFGVGAGVGVLPCRNGCFNASTADSRRSGSLRSSRATKSTASRLRWDQCQDVNLRLGRGERWKWRVSECDAQQQPAGDPPPRNGHNVTAQN